MALNAWGFKVRKIGVTRNAVKAGRMTLARAGVCSLVALTAAGCTITGNSIDNAFQTNAISMAEPSPSIAVDPFAAERGDDPGDTDRLIDEDTIRLSVTTANLDRLQDGQLPWASAATGSTGTVSDIRQSKIAGQICRAFNATRNAYDGVSLYQGEVCLDPRSGWWTRTMDRVGTQT